MSQEVHGDLLNAEADVLVNDFNCVGVRGSALQVSKTWPPEPEQRTVDASKVEMTLGRTSLVTQMNRCLLPALDPFVSFLEIHLLMYFLNVGEPLRPSFVNGHFGSYADTNKVEGHLARAMAPPPIALRIEARFSLPHSPWQGRRWHQIRTRWPDWIA